MDCKSSTAFLLTLPLCSLCCKITLARLACQSLGLFCNSANCLSEKVFKSANLFSKFCANDFSGIILKIRPVSPFNTSFPQISASCQSSTYSPPSGPTSMLKPTHWALFAMSNSSACFAIKPEPFGCKISDKTACSWIFAIKMRPLCSSGKASD